MKIIPVVPRGYCKGVYRAIKIAKEAATNYPNKKIYMLGMIVHNRYVVEACQKYNITCIEDKTKTREELLDLIDEGVVIFTAHGVNKKVWEKAKAKNLEIIDASCEDVLKTHNIILNHVNHGDVIYIGKNNHPETQGAITLADNIYLVTCLEDIDKLPSTLHNVLITNQTTMSIIEIQELIERCKAKYIDATICDEICNATRMRQEAILKLENVDCLIIVGDPASNNTKKLRDIATDRIKHIYMIENVNDLTIGMLEGIETIAISSGASTPTYLTEQVINCIRHYDQFKVLKKEDIDIDHILD